MCRFLLPCTMMNIKTYLCIFIKADRMVTYYEEFALKYFLRIRLWNQFNDFIRVQSNNYTCNITDIF